MPVKLTPTEKSPAMDAFLKNVLGCDRHLAIANLHCSHCYRKVDPDSFSELDLREYRISGWCPTCATELFNG